MANEKVDKKNVTNRLPFEVVRWGIIGVGDVCHIKSGPAFQKCEGSELVAVMRRTESLAKDFALRYGVPAWYSDVDKLLCDPNVNAVYIATPPGSHLEIALKCAASNKPTFIEKPVARNTTETLCIIDAFAKRGVPLFSAYYRRGQKRFIKAQEIVKSGQLGKITSLSYSLLKAPFVPQSPSISLPWRLRGKYAGGGLIMDLGCHTIDIIDFIVGPLHNVHGVATNTLGTYAVEDSISLCATLENGAIATMSWSFAAPEEEDLIVIRGTSGVLKLSTFGDEPILLTSVIGEDNVRKVQEFHIEKPKHAHQPLVQLIVDELRCVNGNKKSPSKGDNALRCAKVLDAILQSYYGDRTDDFWEREGKWPGQHICADDASHVGNKRQRTSSL